MLIEMEKVQQITWMGNSKAVTLGIEKKKVFSVLKTTCMLAAINVHCRDG